MPRIHILRRPMALDTRQRILAAADRVIRQHGLVGATTRLIAKEAGCADGTLYVHFPDRQELFLALLDENLPTLKDALQRLIDRVGRRTVRANLVDVARPALRFFEEVTPVMGALFGEPSLLAAYRNTLRTRQRGPQRGVEALVLYLERERDIGRVSPTADLVAAAHIVLGGAFFHEFLHQFAGEPRMPQAEERLVQSLATAAWRLVAPRRPHKPTVTPG